MRFCRQGKVDRSARRTAISDQRRQLIKPVFGGPAGSKYNIKNILLYFFIHIYLPYQVAGLQYFYRAYYRLYLRELQPLQALAHYELFLSPAVAPTILPFLDGKSGPQSWAEQVKKQ